MLLLMQGCTTDDVADDDDDDDDIVAIDDDDSADPPHVVALHPAADASDHLVHERLWVDFDVPVADPIVALTTADGTDAPGRGLWLTETRFAFEPIVPLDHETRYIASVTWTDAGSATTAWEFDTSLVGSVPVGDGPVGSTFALDLAAGTVVSPVGGSTILQQMEPVMLHEIRAADGDTIAFLGAMAAVGSDPPAQDFCSPSFALDAEQPNRWNDPYFHAGPADVPQIIDLPWLGVTALSFRGFELSGVFSSSMDGGPTDQIIGGSFSTVVDVRDTGVSCDKLRILFPEVDCATCPDDPTSAQCLIFYVIGLEAAPVEGLSLVEWTPADIEATSDCPD